MGSPFTAPAEDIVLFRLTAAQWASINPVLKHNQLAYETDTFKAKWGDDSTAYTSLPYWNPAAIGLITGSISAAANPNYPAATAGDLYLFTGAGKIGGGSGVTVEVGDMAFAIATNAGGTQAAVGTSWTVLQTNLTAAQVAALIHASSGKTTPADGDEIGLLDSATAFGMKVLTWANLKATLKAYFDTLYDAIGAAAAVTAASIGLGNVTNTSDANKPVSTAQQTALNLKQNSLTGTFSLANFTLPATGVASAAMGGAVGVLIFGYVAAIPDNVVTNTQTFAVETAAASGVYTDVVVAGIDTDASNLGGNRSFPFSFFVPTGRKWKHTTAGSASVASISGIVL